MKYLVLASLVLAFAVAACGPSEEAVKQDLPKMKKPATMAEPAFGGPEDAAYAEKLWRQMEKLGFNSTHGVLQPGESPHGDVIEIIEGMIGSSKVIVKRNYAGEGVSVEAVEADRAMYLAAITVMAKRETGYDTDNLDWFWVKYDPDGAISANPQGRSLAGRVAKGMDTGCIACHQGAADSEMLFSLAEGSELEVTPVEAPPMKAPAEE